MDDEPGTAAPRRRPAWLDWLDATDPGQMRLRMATEIVLAIGVVLAAEYLFVRATGALQVAVPPRAPAAVASQLWMLNHALMVIAMMLGAILAMIGGFGVGMFGTARAQLLLLGYLPLPMLALLAVGLSVHVRVVSLALLAVVLAAGTYCRRFGPPGFMGGMLAFMGAFLGFFIQDYVTLGDFGWLAAEVLIGTAGIIAVHFAFFRPRPETALRRMQRSYAARARALASDVAELVETTTRSGDPGQDPRAERQLQRQLLRLNEAALLIDSQLNSPAAVPAGWSAAALHQRLFDAETGLSNVARFALALARRPLPARARALVLAALAGARDGDRTAVSDAAAEIAALLEDHDPGRTGVAADDRILLHRFAMSVTDLAAALGAFRQYPASQPPDDLPAGEFQPQVATFGGWLPGSAFIAGAASQERGGSGLIERIRLAPYARISIQMGIAVGAAIIAGDALSGRRFYWAVIAAFITFMGANTAGEQLRKGLFRVLGTVVGVVAGSVIAHLVGDQVWLQIVVVLVSLFLGLYLFRINYAFMTVGITVMVSQLYVELDELSNSLLLLRLAETAVGAGVAILTVLLVLPLHVGRVARVAARQELEALADLTDRCLDRLADPASAAGSDLELRAAARRVDTAYQALAATVRPMRTPLLGSLANRIAGFMATAVAARHYARNLLLDASTRYADLDAGGIAELAVARRQLAESVGAVTAALAPGDGSADGHDGENRDGGSADGTGGDSAGAGGGFSGGSATGTVGEGPRGREYVRSASLFARVADTLPEQPATSRPRLALRDLQLLDGALAEAARWAGVPVTDLDTALR
ncbi:MAG TPA: FUSC family protein [Trebonia sp.]|nr:FUSC family protein [Trebonia sp.]